MKSPMRASVEAAKSFEAMMFPNSGNPARAHSERNFSEAEINKARANFERFSKANPEAALRISKLGNHPDVVAHFIHSARAPTEALVRNASWFPNSFSDQPRMKQGSDKSVMNQGVWKMFGGEADG